MNVVWSYVDWTGEGKSELQTRFGDIVTLLASVSSVKKYGPSCKRIFNCCPIIYDFLKSHKIDHLWDEINVVDFKHELVDRYHVDFFAYPKVWSYIHLEDSSWILDTDTIFTNDSMLLEDEMFPSSILCNYYYPITDPCSVNRFAEIGSWKKELDLARPFFRDLIPENLGVFGGGIYFPNVEVAKVIGYSIFGAFPDLVKFSTSEGECWRIFEEVLLAGIFKGLGQQCNVFDFSKIKDNGVYHCYVRPNKFGEEGYLSLKDYVECSKILGSDFLEKYPWIEREFGIKVVKDESSLDLA